MAAIVSRLRLTEVDSVILVGGFGRGEGSIIFLPNGRIAPVGDYDIYIITDSNIDTDRMRKDMIKIISLPAVFRNDPNMFGVDIEVISRRNLIRLSPDISTYELKMASKLLYGKDYRDLIPFSKDDIAVSSGFITLSIRAMMLSKVLEKIRKGNLSYEERIWCVYQCCKVFTEICTALSLVEGFYEPSYEKRALLFAQNFQNMKGLKDRVPELHEKVREYTFIKLLSKFDEKAPMEALAEARRYLEVSFLYFMSKFIGVKFEEDMQQQNLEKMYNALRLQFLRPYLLPFLEKRRAWFKPLISFLVLGGQLFENLIFIKKLLETKGTIYLKPLLFCCLPSVKTFIAANLAFFSVDVSTMKINGSLLKKGHNCLLKVYPCQLPHTVDWSDWQIWKKITEACAESLKLNSAGHRKKAL